jgi:hypothetical protein
MIVPKPEGCARVCRWVSLPRGSTRLHLFQRDGSFHALRLPAGILPNHVYCGSGVCDNAFKNDRLMPELIWRLRVPKRLHVQVEEEQAENSTPSTHRADPVRRRRSSVLADEIRLQQRRTQGPGRRCGFSEPSGSLCNYNIRRWTPMRPTVSKPSSFKYLERDFFC